MYKLTILGIFKNESHILEEWILHYLSEGAEHFYLINNDSTDEFEHIIEKYSSLITYISDPEKFGQSDKYNKYFLRRCKEETKWLAILDLDEFAYSRNGFLKITDYLNSIDENVDSIRLPWKLFASNGHIEQPSNVVNNFTKRQRHMNYKIHVSKCIVRTKNLREIDMHRCLFFTVPHVEFLSNGQEFLEIPIELQTYMRTNIESHCIHLNHYIIQSKTWFMKVKATRGSCATLENDNVRTLEYFESFDKNEIEDQELFLKKP